MNKCKKNGSVTVEAVFIVPLCLLVVFLLIESGLYLHHQSWYTEAAWECVLAGADAGEAAALSHWKNVAGKQAFPIHRIRAGASGREGRLDVSVQGGVSGIWRGAGMDFSIRVRREQIPPAEFVLRVHRLKKMRKEGL